MASASIQSCVFLEIKVDVNSYSKKNDNVNTSTFIIIETSLFFMLGRPTSIELSNIDSYKRMEVNKSFCEKVKSENPLGENEKTTCVAKTWGLMIKNIVVRQPVSSVG